MRVRRIKIGIRHPDESLQEAKEVARRLKAGEKARNGRKNCTLLIWLRYGKPSRRSDWRFCGLSWSMSLVQCER